MAMKICKECGTEVSTGAKACPKCGKDQRIFFVKHKVLTFFIAVILIAVIATSAGGNTSNNQTSETGVTKTQEKFTLESSEVTERNEFAYYIEGTIKNNTNKQYTYVQVTFNLYDADGAQIGTAIDNLNNLEANGVWKYKAMHAGSDSQNVASFKLVEITGW